MSRLLTVLLSLISLIVLAACSETPVRSDVGFYDVGRVEDAGEVPDSGARDIGSTDLGARPDSGHDAGSSDAGSSDAGSSDAGSTDAGSTDADPTDASDTGASDTGSLDAGRDTGLLDLGPADTGAADAAEDAGVPDSGAMDSGAIDSGPSDVGVGDAGSVTCPNLSVGSSPALDGNSDLTKYPITQHITPGATLASSDAFAISWDRDHLFITVVSAAFADAFEPVHVYLEVAGAPPGAAMPTTGKEYGGLTPALPFSATHLIGLRRDSAGGGAPYNGIYTPGNAWTDMPVTFTLGVDQWAAADDSALSARVAWSALGCPSALRLTAHVVHGAIANEWKDLLPGTATPWTPGGAYYEIDPAQPPPVSNWLVVP